MSLRERLTQSVLGLPGVVQRKSRFHDDPAFYTGRREFAHFHSANEMDIRLTKGVIREMGLENSGDPRLAVTGGSDWVEFSFRRRKDLERAVELVEAALEANR